MRRWMLRQRAPNDLILLKKSLQVIRQDGLRRNHFPIFMGRTLPRPLFLPLPVPQELQGWEGEQGTAQERRKLAGVLCRTIVNIEFTILRYAKILFLFSLQMTVFQGWLGFQVSTQQGWWLVEMPLCEIGQLFVTPAWRCIFQTTGSYKSSNND